MDKTLVKRSDFMKVKYKFFLNRVVTYFSFLLFPVLLYQTQEINLFTQSLMLLVYIVFMIGQWYLLGKEIDHRLKIYYRVNSSMDRTVYRVFMGSMAMILLFNFVSLFPVSFSSYFFWIFFVCLGIFYSWPTRGKIIEDSMSNQFGEMKFLDSFERTVFLLILITIFVSLPDLPLFENIDALKIYLDPSENVSEVWWSFLSVLYLPFEKYPRLYNLAWSFHFYFYGMGFFVAAFYGLLRHFVSRRLSILGVFAVLSSWSFTRILGADFFSSMTTTLLLLWVWSVMWSSHSGTYRSGFFSGLVCAYLTLINAKNIVFIPVTLVLFYFLILKEQTVWFRKQWLKYSLFGVVVSIVIAAGNFQSVDLESLQVGNFDTFLNQIYDFFYRKAFFVISPLGFILSSHYLVKKDNKFLTNVQFSEDKLKELMYCLLIAICIGLSFQKEFVQGFSLIWVLALFSLIPLEWIFQSISRLRSKRNLIYVLYILVCLLDSHLENRIRIVGKMFLDEEQLKYLIQL